MSTEPPPLHPGPCPGRILLVATPIGNLGDISDRAVRALGSADRIACEDTRRTGRLLEHLGVSAPKLVRMDQYTERAVAGAMVEAASRGEVVAVVSDAGMPALSDPGSAVVEAAIASGVPLEVVPGAFAGATAAVLSGLTGASGRFGFEGFLPRKGRARAERLRELAESRIPVVLYESPHRLRATVEDLLGLCGDTRRISLSRELTKLHEETWRGTLGDAVEHLGQTEPRGEYVLVLDAAPPPSAPGDEELLAALQRRLADGESRRDAAAAVPSLFGVPPNRVKRLANP